MKMSKCLKLCVLLITILAVQACTSAHLRPVANPQQAMKPQPGKALVVFMRPSSFGGAIQSTVYDGEKYISTVSAATRVAYQAQPGEHMFMVIGESADFLKATLSSDKTYYALVSPRMGLWKARFSFQPVRKSESMEQLNEWLNDTTLMEPNAEGLQWARENQYDITNKRNKYLSEWQNKDSAARDAQTLFAEDGR
jgi:hypothetical protein